MVMLQLSDSEAQDLVAIMVSGRAGLRSAATKKREIGVSGDNAERLADLSEVLSSRLLDARTPTSRN
jgi:hypothetical protein